MVKNDNAYINETLDAIISTDRAVDAYLKEEFLSDQCENKKLSEIIGNSIDDKGFRLRPFLLRASYERGQRSFDEILPIAAGIELIQLSTLVIDDILDKSPLRNGRPSVFMEHGTECAIICGFVMASTGMDLIANMLQRNERLRNRVHVLELIERTHAEIYVGQFMDLDCEASGTISEEEYFETIRKTTASFIGAPLVIGAMLWDAPKDVISILGEAGMKLGLAYQLRDDIIDIIGEPELTGKPRAMDIQDRKMRLPVIHALANLDTIQREKLLAVWDSKEKLNRSQVQEVILMLDHVGSIEYCIKKVRAYCSEVEAAIEKLYATSRILADRLRVVAKLISRFEGD